MIGSNEPLSHTVKTRQPLFAPGYGVVVIYLDTMVKYYIEPKTVRVVVPEGATND